MQDRTTRPAHNLFFGPEGLRAGWALLTFFGIFALAVGTFSALAHALHHTSRAASSSITGIAPGPFFLNEVLLVLAMAVATAIMSRVEQRPLTRYGTAGTRMLPHFLAGLACGAAFLSLLVLTLKLTGLLLFDHRLLFGPATLFYGILWSLGFLLVALFEEGLMRGYLQVTLARGCAAIFHALNVRHSQTVGFWTAALILSTLFGLGHRSNPGESPLGLASAALVGLVFCLSLWRTGSLWWAIGFHAAWDWAQSFLYGVADSGFFIQHRLFATHPAGRPLLSGGATGPEGSLFLFPVLILATAALFITTRRNPSLTQPASSLIGSPPDPVPAPETASHRH